jgi:hypothetical protein
VAPMALVRSSAFDRTALFKIRVADVPHRFRQHIAPLVFRSKQYQVYKSFHLPSPPSQAN